MGRLMSAPQYYIYIALPSRLAKRVEAIGRKHPGTSRSAPHITLVIPRTLVTGRSERDLVRALRDAAASLAPCRIRYRGVAYFGSKDFILVPVHKTQALLRCRDACVRAVRPFLEQRRPDQFLRPHITLAGRLMAEDGERAWQALRHRSFDGQFLCREILLWRMGPGGTRWRLVSRIRLGSKR